MTKKNEKLNIVSGLVGEHLIAPLALSAVLALSLGMQPRVIEKALADTKPFEHRMQPYRLQKAWIIDDTYNGNIEGMRAGLTLLSQLKAKRKIYVTPGLVEQGKNTKQIHEQLGLMIASSQPDKVVLMKNSVCDYILLGLNKGNFVGQVIIEDDPLSYYENLELHVSEGDLVLLQNDWPDSYQ